MKLNNRNSRNLPRADFLAYRKGTGRQSRLSQSNPGLISSGVTRLPIGGLERMQQFRNSLY